MPSTEAISSLIGSLYDCVVAPENWAGTIDALRVELNFANAVLGTNLLPSGEMGMFVSAGISPDWQARMSGYGTEIMQSWGGVDRIHTFALDEPVLQSQAVDYVQSRVNRWIIEWAMPQGLIDAVTIPIARDAHMVGSLTCGRHYSAGEVTEAEMEVLRLIAPHIRRAVAISQLLDQKMIAAATFASTLESVLAGVILVDRNLSIVHANATAAAMLGIGDPVGSRHGMLVIPNALAFKALRTAVRLASKSELDLGRRGIGIPIRHRDGAASAMHVLPLHRKHLRRDLVQRASAALFITSSSPPRLPADAVGMLYDLTPAELRVFELIIEGKTQREIATFLSVAPSTVKTHLLRVFEKTGCNRQASLVRLAASMSVTL